MKPVRILLTGFEPFGGETVNPALEAVKLVRAPEDVQLNTLAVPVSFRDAIPTAAAVIRAKKPDVVLLIGQAGGRPEITVERVAINLMDAVNPDNDGFAPRDLPILRDGPAAYFSTLPVREITDALNLEGIPARLSCTAGTYVCNQLMYGVLHILKEEFPCAAGGFMHVPYLPEQAARLNKGLPSMSLDLIVRGIEATLQVAADRILSLRENT